jgi:hypothetical protein
LQHGARRRRRRLHAAGHGLTVVAATAATVLGAAGCGTRAHPATTSGAHAAAPSPAELRWRADVRRFAAGLVVALRQVQAATGGGAAGAVGARLQPAVLAPGVRRRRYDAALAALVHCGETLQAEVPAPPAPRFTPVRTSLTAACTSLASAARELTGLAGARTPALARAEARQGVRLVVDALTTLEGALRRG